MPFTMDDLLGDFENFKISALSKSKEINSFVKNTTIGPNSSIIEDDEITVSDNTDSKSTKITVSDNTDSKSTKTPRIHTHGSPNTTTVLSQLLAEMESQRQAKVQDAVKYHISRMVEFSKKLSSNSKQQYQRQRQVLVEARQQQELLILQAVEQHDKDTLVHQQQLSQYYRELAEKRKQRHKEIEERQQRGLLAMGQEKIATLGAVEQQQVKEIPKPEPVLVVPQPPKPTITRNPATVAHAAPDAKAADIKTTNIDKFISKSSLRMYSELQDYLENYTKSCDEFTQNNSFKQFRFDCKKAVNIPVNAISAVSTHHLLDKYTRLTDLLCGKTVEVGNTRVCATRHPQGLAFCTNLLAKQLVLQADLMISSVTEAAFCYAAIIVAIWHDNADFGKLLLGHFHKQCPYLVPLQPPRAVGQSDEEFYLSQGYQYTDGVVEKQDKFIKRMTGIMRLYAAIIITKPKRGQHKNPLGLTEGWRWLAAFLNLQPQPVITATMLHVFFQIAGSTLQVAYGKMFQKIVFYVCHAYLPMIQKIDSGGPVTRLEVLLQEYQKRGYFEAPRGLLPSNFW